MKKYSVLSLFHETAFLLKEEFSPQEIQSLQKIIFEKKLGLPLHKVFQNPSDIIEPHDAENIIDIVSKLKLQKPIQYILGEADFFGLIFMVTPEVLIPRQETEELVDWIIKSNESKVSNILDIGTGSGCIAISLAKNLSGSKITALDISRSALSIAQRNALINKVNIDFVEGDILDPNISIHNIPFDIIVSNPPYVRKCEKTFMKPNVLDNEPEVALFVDDGNPLIFYKAIASVASRILKQGGTVFCEINEALGEELFQLFSQQNFVKVEIRKDLNGKDRMLKAIMK